MMHYHHWGQAYSFSRLCLWKHPQKTGGELWRPMAPHLHLPRAPWLSLCVACLPAGAICVEAR
eukprot:3756133-Amphidinium_carterae.1